MKSNKTWAIAYLLFGLCVCLGFGVAAAKGWRAPNLGLLDGSSGGRSYGGSWGGGK
jgi:hypothetical protein